MGYHYEMSTVQDLIYLVSCAVNNKAPDPQSRCTHL